MHAPHAASRREFLKLALAAATVSGLTACGATPALDRQLVFRTLADALKELERLAASPALKRDAVWTWPETLVHCAQSIEFSMSGFPEPKPALFQQTVGAAAFEVFAWRGRMSHNLAEPIPGAPAFEAGVGAPAAAARLRKAVKDFMGSTAPLRPHFAYGSLSKAEYEQAHAMHLANHFSSFEA